MSMAIGSTTATGNPCFSRTSDAEDYAAGMKIATAGAGLAGVYYVRRPKEVAS